MMLFNMLFTMEIKIAVFSDNTMFVVYKCKRAV